MFRSKTQAEAFIKRAQEGELDPGIVYEMAEATRDIAGGLSAIPDSVPADHAIPLHKRGSVTITAGQLLVNSKLPQKYRDYTRRMDVPTVKALMNRVAKEDPDKYSEIVHGLLQAGEQVAYRDGMSILRSDLEIPRVKHDLVKQLDKQVEIIMDNPQLTPQQKSEMIVKATAASKEKLDAAVVDAARAGKSKLVELAESGVRGKMSNVAQMLGALMLVTDHKKEPIAFPITSNYAEGHSPADYFALAAGVRSSYADIKLATPRAGYLSKQMSFGVHRQLVSDDIPMEGTGLPVRAADKDNIGAVLAHPVAGYKAGTVIDSKVFKDIQRAKPNPDDRILVHSPISAICVDGRIPKMAAGIRSNNDFPTVESAVNVGVESAHTISEPTAQTAISSKHSAGAFKGEKIQEAGLPSIEKMIAVPSEFPNHATLAAADGAVGKIEEAPQGGWYVPVNGERHYVAPEQDLTVRPGQMVEAGDTLSTGTPNPAEVVKYKGIGEGRRYFMEKLQDILKNSGIKTSRRNIEMLSRGLINHVEVTGPNVGGYLPGDIAPYDDLAAHYVPRKDSVLRSASSSAGKYLESPVLHYAVGTRITPTVAKTMKEFDVDQVMVNDKPPEFEPVMVRSADQMSSDPDWMTQLAGFQLQRNFLKSVHRGATTPMHGASYVAPLAAGLEFGTDMKRGY